MIVHDFLIGTGSGDLFMVLREPDIDVREVISHYGDEVMKIVARDP